MKTFVHEYFNAFFKKHKITQKRFCELTGVPESTIKSLKAKGFYPSFETLKKIVEVFPDFALMKGMGDGDGVEPAGSSSMPYYNVSLASGWNNLDDHYSYSIDVPSLAARDNVFWINHVGESMSPLILAGDRIALEKKDVSDLTMGKIYGIVTIKRLRSVSWVVRSPKEGCVRLLPENTDPKFGGYQEISLMEISEVYEVVGTLRTF